MDETIKRRISDAFKKYKPGNPLNAAQVAVLNDYDPEYVYLALTPGVVLCESLAESSPLSPKKDTDSPEEVVADLIHQRLMIGGGQPVALVSSFRFESSPALSVDGDQSTMYPFPVFKWGLNPPPVFEANFERE